MLDPKRIWMSSQLPTLPSVAVRLLELTRDPETEIRQVIEVINSDPAIAAKILKAANSSFFGLSSEVRTLEKAVPLLGTTVSTSLALSFSLTDDAMSRGPVAEHYQSYWRQSIVQAAAAELLALRQDKTLAGEYFLCGLLLDLGRLAMLKTIPRQYIPVLDTARSGQKPLFECETESLGFNHVDIGGKLLENWKLPSVMVQAAKYHHAPLDDLAALQGQTQESLVTAMVAAANVGSYFCSPRKGEALDRLQQLTQARWQMTAADLDQFLQQVDERCKQAGDLFKVDMTQLGSPTDLMTEANEQLSQLTMKEHLAGRQAAVRQMNAEAEIKALETRNVELQKQAVHDPLTKLYNRHFFDEVLEKEINRCIRTASPVGVLFADVDFFKRLNDTYGHQAGDAVLQRIAVLFNDAVRESDTVARYGGEEFVILASQPTEKGVEKLANRIRERVASEAFEFKGVPVRVTISLGAAVVVPGRLAKNADKTLIAAADACLYESKQAGRNRVTVRSLIGEDDRRLLLQLSQQRFSRWLVARDLIDIPVISKAMVECQPSTLRIGELAVKHQLLTPDQVASILAMQEKQPSLRFGELAIQRTWLTECQLSRLLAWQQEDPNQLATILIRLGLMAPEKVAAALEDYMQSVTAAAAAV